MKTFENLSNNSRGLIRGFLLMLSAIPIYFDLSGTYWVGLVHGAVFAAIINELLMYWRIGGRRHQPLRDDKDAMDCMLQLPNFLTF